MCGLIGFSQTTGVNAEHVASRMSAFISHRGPDAQAIWYDKYDEVGSIVLAHQRLSILDLSPTGNQPMHSICGRYVIAYNGEIYNHLDLRVMLATQGKTIKWRGHSDTETLLECFSSWGIKKTLKSATGMFAIALWDRREKILTLARDRFGEKPLYWGWSGNTLLFASELKALKAHPNFREEIDRKALALLLRYSYIPAPHSIYSGIKKLLPGHFVKIPLIQDIHISKKIIPECYWSLNNIIRDGLTNPFQGSECEAIDLLERQLTASIAQQSIADVSVGAFLSGGVDSSTVAALMQAQSNIPVHTFTIGFDDAIYNEAKYASAVAKHLNTDHTELYIQGKDALKIIPRLPSIYCEPFADSSQIPTFLVSQIASKYVKVTLSGDGGDELFCGYNRYLAFAKIWKPIQRLPYRTKQYLAFILNSIPSAQWDKFFNLCNPILPNWLRISAPGEKVRKLSEILSLSGPFDYYQYLISLFNNPCDFIINCDTSNNSITNNINLPHVDCNEHLMMAIDAQTYLPDDILVKVDRAAMANSLETRTPLLDHRIAELAWKMPLNYKIRNSEGKWLLRQVLYRHVPRELIERPKMGFAIPLDKWLHGPLRDWAEELLCETRLLREGYFYPQKIRNMWMEYLSGKKNWQYHLWNVLMFQAWLAKQ